MAVLEKEILRGPARSYVSAPADAEFAQWFPSPRLWTRDEYHKMAEAGILRPGERVQLIEGKIIKMPPIGPTHGASTDPVGNIFRITFGAGFTLRTQNPIVLSDLSEPEPDIAMVIGDWRDYKERTPEPSDVRLIVEISASTLNFDRTEKMRLYAREGIVEYWILNLRDKQIEVHREPTDTGYADIRVYESGTSVAPLHAPGKPIKVSDCI